MNKFKKSSTCVFGLCVEVNLDAQRPAMGVGGFASDTDVGKEGVLVRKSDNPEVVVFFTNSEWKTFVMGVKLGEFDK